MRANTGRFHPAFAVLVDETADFKIVVSTLPKTILRLAIHTAEAPLLESAANGGSCCT